MPNAHFTVQYCPVPESLAPFVQSIFYTDVEQAGRGRVHDLLFPEWACLRFQFGELWQASMHGGDHSVECRFAVSGPRTQAMRFSMGSGQQWGFRLLPLGWTTLVGAPADGYADTVVDGDSDDTFTRFWPLHALLGTDDPPRTKYEKLTGFLEALPECHAVYAGLARDIDAAILDPDMRTSMQLAERVGANPRTLERACRAVFGFTPKTLLRRQRFLRSLEHYARDPSLRWVGAMDSSYHDQAQFVRDFRFFMGMTPRQYAALDKPVNDLLMRQRLRAAEGRGEGGAG